MAADGKRLYVSSGGAKAVLVLDTGTDTFVASISVGERPWNLRLSKSGDRLYVANG